MEFTPCPVFHQPQQPRLPQDIFVQQQQQDYHYQTVQYCLTTQQQYNFVQQDTTPVQHHQHQQHHPQVALYHHHQQQQQQQPSPLALSGVTASVDSPGQSSVDSGYCAAAASASLQTPAYYASSDVVLGAPSSTSLKGTAVGGSGEGGLSKQLQHRNSQHSQSANNPQGEKQPQEDDLDRLLEMEMATAVGSENSSSAVR